MEPGPRTMITTEAPRGSGSGASHERTRLWEPAVPGIREFAGRKSNFWLSAPAPAELKLVVSVTYDGISLNGRAGRETLVCRARAPAFRITAGNWVPFSRIAGGAV